MSCLLIAASGTGGHLFPAIAVAEALPSTWDVYWLGVPDRLEVELLPKKYELTTIRVGGINSAHSAWERIAAGASLVQIYTGWIFEGPTLVPVILDGISSQLDRHGFKSISEVVGSNAPWL